MKWINVNTKLPEYNGYYLVYRKENTFPTTREFFNNKWVTKATVLYWMELPKSPKIK